MTRMYSKNRIESKKGRVCVQRAQEQQEQQQQSPFHCWLI
jgi:hypothetical protein